MSSRSLDDLTPATRERIVLLQHKLAEAGHTHFQICCTYRSQAEQNALWKRGRKQLYEVNLAYERVGMPEITAKQNKQKVTWTTISRHTSRTAVDFYISIDGRYCDDTKVDIDKDQVPDWLEFAEIAKSCGLTPGAFWKKPDYGHVQYDGEG